MLNWNAYFDCFDVRAITQDMAAAVAYLASDDASYVTAETLVIAGGMQSRL